MAELEITDDFIVLNVNRCIAALQLLHPDNLYKAEVLCCEFWHRINPAKHSPVGRRLYQLAINDYLPLEPIGKDSDKAMLYRLK